MGNYTEGDCHRIESNLEMLTFQDEDEETGLVFSLMKKNYNKLFHFTFDLRYWPAYQGDGQKSGDYIFRPKNNTYDSIRYSQLSKVISQ